MRKILALAAASALALSTAAFADDTKAKENDPKSDTKPTKDMVYAVSCDSPCHFSVSSEDKKEVIDIVTAHAKSHHDMDLDAKDVETIIKTTEAPK